MASELWVGSIVVVKGSGAARELAVGAHPGDYGM